MISIESPVNSERYDFLKETMDDFFPELKEAFLEDGFLLFRDAKQGLENNQIDNVSTAVHTLKSSARNIGAEQLGEYCAEMEEAIKSDQLDKLPQLYKTALTEMRKVKEFLEGSD